jgi:serine/threonine protein kinase
MFLTVGLPKEGVKFYAAQIVLALEQLQSQNVAHRDLKPGNIMIEESQYIKVIDFGESKIVEKGEDDSLSMNSKASKYSKRTVSAFNRQETASEADSYFGRMLAR